MKNVDSKKLYGEIIALIDHSLEGVMRCELAFSKAGDDLVTFSAPGERAKRHAQCGNSKH